MRVRVRRHRGWTLKRARSFQQFLRPFSHQTIAFDPTGVFSRAAMLVRFAGSARAVCQGLVKRVLWHPESGAIYVVLEAAQLPSEPEARSVASRRIEQVLSDALRGCGAVGETAIVKSLRIGFADPVRPMIPIDAPSVIRNASVLDRVVRAASLASLSPLVATLGLGIASARADDLGGGPAVSSLNGEMAVMGGSYDGNGSFVVEGAATSPVGNEWGLRGDVALGSIGGHLVGGVAGHLFWRDPTRGLFGLTGGLVWSDAASAGTRRIGVVAVEGEHYFDQATFAGMVGYQSSDAGKDGFVGRAEVEWYASDDLMLSAGLEVNPQRDWLQRLGLEYRPGFEALPGLSVFAEGAVGEHDYRRAVAGIRYYFGPSATLKDKHRRDTFRSHLLPTRMIDSLDRFQTGGYGG